MIALKDGLPCLEFEAGELVEFRKDWLVSSLAHAAHKAGYPKWWLAGHVAESVTEYLRLHCTDNVVAVSRVVQTVQSVLQVIGYAEVATQFRPSRPPVRISLAELAGAAGNGFELAFFDLLHRRVRHALSHGISQLEFHGLERCVKKLRVRKAWSRDCDALRSEIVDFVREQVTAWNPSGTIHLSVC
jgi:hypothetical protein